MWRAALVAVLVLVLASGAATWLGWRVLHEAYAPPSGGAVIAIAPGEGFRSVAERLQAAGVVRCGWLLSLWARANGLDRQVRPGDYRFDVARTSIEVLEVLRSPTAALHRVTIPEGSTVAQVAALFAAQGFGGVDAFLCAARDPKLLAELDLPATGVEGYLFPDTYILPWAEMPADIVRRMVSRFRDVAAEMEPARQQRDLAQHAWVTLASIIEKETGADKERALVAAVFHNRLRRQWPLQSDPTVIYGLPSFDGDLTKAQLHQPTRYNTYTNTGLPPGPICNPGRAALAAALQPAPVDYLYFVARGDGSHQFSKTLEEHNRAVEKYQMKR
ncbi:MAG TPA: endolytic transglycosylase MltG [Candidatus Kryptonia bacterium]|nr:endolytic transglycosylase MltG [Candidatus Kryptonia bacterium]